MLLIPASWPRALQAVLHRTVRAGAALAVPVALLLPSSTAPPPPPGTVEQGAREVQTYLDRAVEQGLPGLAVSATRGGATLFSAGAGTSGGRPVDGGTRIRVESVSKTFTSAAVMLLVEDGLVDLDDAVTSHLPELELADGREDEITVRQLLMHASGLSDATAARDEYAPGPRSLEAAVAGLGGAHLATDPGSTYAYHNANFWLAARLVEVVSGAPFADVLRDELFVPLAMTDSLDLPTAAAPVAGAAPGHTFVLGRAVGATGPDYFTEGAGGVVSTADDLARWLSFQAGHGPALLAQSSLDELHRRQAPDGYLSALGWNSGPSAEGGPTRVSHSGVGAGHSSYAGWFPGDDLGIAVLALHGGALGAPQPYRIAQDVRAIVLGERPGPAPAAPPAWPDAVAATVSLLLTAAAVRGTTRARRWAARHIRWWSRTLRLLPGAVGAAMLPALPGLQLRITGRAADIVLLSFVSPVLVASLAVLGLSCAALVVARLLALPGRHQSTDQTRPSPGRG